jgi:hypothetical protein
MLRIADRRAYREMWYLDVIYLIYSLITTLILESSDVDLERGKGAPKLNLATSFNATNGANLGQKT